MGKKVGTKADRIVDAQGRVSIPGYLRELAGIDFGDTVTVEVDQAGIHIYAKNDRCCICGERHEKLLPVPIGPFEHKFCVHCARTICNTLKK